MSIHWGAAHSKAASAAFSNHPHRVTTRSDQKWRCPRGHDGGVVVLQQLVKEGCIIQELGPDVGELSHLGTRHSTARLAEVAEVSVSPGTLGELRDARGTLCLEHAGAVVPLPLQGGALR